MGAGASVASHMFPALEDGISTVGSTTATEGTDCLICRLLMMSAEERRLVDALDLNAKALNDYIDPFARSRIYWEHIYRE